MRLPLFAVHAHAPRAVEILETTGKRPSEAKTRTASPYDVLAFLLEWPRETLRKRIDARTHVLLESGWIDETWRLLARGFTREDPGMKSHGYRDIIDAIVLEAQKRGVSIAGEPPEWLASIAYDPAVYASIASQTRQYAKRQTTWWRGDERLVRVSMA